MPLSKPAPPAARRLSFLRDLWPFLRPYRGRVALAFALLCLSSATILLMPLAFRDLIDFGFGQRTTLNDGLMGTLSLDGHFAALFGLASLWALSVAARYYTVTWVGERVTADLRSAVYARVLTQSPQFFETLQTGDPEEISAYLATLQKGAGLDLAQGVADGVGGIEQDVGADLEFLAQFL